jgi:hypothetical protein
MSIPADVSDKRHYKVTEGEAFGLANGEKLFSLDDLSEAINLIDPETFHHHVNGDKNDFASWVEHVFGETELSERLREHPTPLRMMVSIEKFLRSSESAHQNADHAA